MYLFDSLCKLCTVGLFDNIYMYARQMMKSHKTYSLDELT